MTSLLLLPGDMSTVEGGLPQPQVPSGLLSPQEFTRLQGNTFQTQVISPTPQRPFPSFHLSGTGLPSFPHTQPTFSCSPFVVRVSFALPCSAGSNTRPLRFPPPPASTPAPSRLFCPPHEWLKSHLSTEELQSPPVG